MVGGGQHYTRAGARRRAWYWGNFFAFSCALVFALITGITLLHRCQIKTYG